MLSNTDWFNRALGLPAVQYEFQPRAEGGSSAIARARLAGLEIVWQELPFEWLEPEFYRVRRVLQRGPFREAVIALELQPQAGGTRAYHHFGGTSPEFAWQTDGRENPLENET